jgi:hypothetical protein
MENEKQYYNLLIAKKTEKLVTAIYLISQFLKDKENIKTESIVEHKTEAIAENRSLISEIFFPHPHMPAIKADILGNVNNWPISNSSMFLFLMVLFFAIFAIFCTSYWVKFLLFF